MNPETGENKPDDGYAKLSPLGIATLVLLVVFLLWALWYSITGWNKLDGVGMSPLGWGFLIVGGLVTLAVGAGLMGLLFYSSRKNFDR